MPGEDLEKLITANKNQEKLEISYDNLKIDKLEKNKIKFDDNIFYKRIIDKDNIIYQGYLTKVKAKNIPCFIARIFSKDIEEKWTIYEKIVYINLEETNIEKKMVIIFNKYDTPETIKEFCNKREIIENDSNSFTISKPVPNWILEKIEQKSIGTVIEPHLLSNPKSNWKKRLLKPFKWINNNKIFLLGWNGIPILTNVIILLLGLIFPPLLPTNITIFLITLAISVFASNIVAALVKIKMNIDQKKLQEQLATKEQWEYKRRTNQRINDKCHDFLKNYLKLEKNKPIINLKNEFQNIYKNFDKNIKSDILKQEIKDKYISTYSKNDDTVNEEKKAIPCQKYMSAI